MVNDFHNLNETDGHREYFRMDEVRLNDLLQRVGPRLQRHTTHAMPIGPALRLSMTLKVLASGDSLKNTAKSYRIGYKTARNIFYETCDALWSVLKDEFLHFPTRDEWKQIAKKFWEKWNFPLCLGAIDGKHIAIKKPTKAGSAYFNYKLDGDRGVFRKCSLGKAIADNTTNRLGIPGFHRLPGSRLVCPHVFVGDDAFPLSGSLLKPYGGTRRSREERIFDYRLTRARGVIENTFGILAARWRIFHQLVTCWPDNVEKIVKAAVVLHNYLKKTDVLSTPENRYMPPHMLDYVDKETGVIREGNWRHDVPADAALQKLVACKNQGTFGQQVRDRFKNYFQTEAGRVPWQDARYNALAAAEIDN